MLNLNNCTKHIELKGKNQLEYDVRIFCIVITD